ncbi:hypothetical protein [Litorihabitans aurantiacus]|uniref:Uncharacterized protein n=1 Tax=Litorihabitans aurantiacus TaxID=1930061 RepID=A0AA37XE90_9MICO|nr:hypothetical protein [Litorihabitans aurantiacus]GMA31578.1 hypothetical protein GCM10025875_15700 [Litorihabitans aurantiacus]
MTTDFPRRIGGFKRTTLWTAGLVLAALFFGLSLYSWIAGSGWRFGLFALGWLVAGVIYAVMLRSERRDFPERR